MKLQIRRQKNSTDTNSYRAGDIIYDIKCGHLAIEVTTAEAADISTPKPAHEERLRRDDIT